MRSEKIALALVVASAIGVSWNNLIKLVDDWETLPAYTHGFLVPIISIFLVYLERKRLEALSDRPSGWGIVLGVLGVVSLLVGTWSGLYYLQQFSILLLVSGIVTGYWGLKTLKTVRFAVLYLLFMIPLPYIVFNSIAFPLQMIAARGASHILNWIDIPVFREGNIINLPHLSLGVVKACSGIQSLISLLAISVLLTRLAPLTGLPAVLFNLSVIPIAVVANMLRIAVTGILGYSVNVRLAEGFFHMFSGWILFVVAFLILVVEIKTIRMLRERSYAA